MKRDATALAVVVLVAAVVCALVIARPWRDRVNWESEEERYFAVRHAIGAPLDPADEVLGVREIVARWKSDGADGEVATVDRCTSCHLGADDRAMARDDVPREMRAHPPGILAAHPIARFGCTVCHGGDGTDTTMHAHARAPRDDGDERDAGRADDTSDAGAHGSSATRGGIVVVDSDMRAFVGALPPEESRCLTCHAREPSLEIDGHEAAPLLSRGKQLYRELGCDACHNGAPGDARISWSLPLDDVTARVKPAWLLAFIRDPRAVRLHTTMPNAWPEPIDPKTSVPFADGTPEHAAWATNMRSESLSIAAFLIAESERDHIGSHAPPVATRLAERIGRWADVPGANAEDGVALAAAIGCRACHAMTAEDDARRSGRARAPSLADAGDAFETSWLAWYLEDPTRAAAHGRMPSARLDRREAASVAAYLATLHVSAREDDRAPAMSDDLATLANAARRNERVLCNVGPGAEMGRAECGERLYVKYGCGGCHSLGAAPPEKRAAPDLDGFAARAPSTFSFGAALADNRTIAAWTARKLDAPHELGSAAGDHAMPDYDLDRGEIAALTVYLTGFTRDAPQPRFDPEARDARAELWRGAWLMRDLACDSCHDGGDDAPPLGREGERVRPEWLFSFLRDPGTHGVRPRLHPEWIWGDLPPTDRLRVRMPTFALTVAETTAIVRTLSERREYPYSDPAVRKLTPDEKLKAISWMNKPAPEGGACFECHFAGDLPRDRAKVDPAHLAPNLGLARARLRPEWTLAAIVDPESALPRGHGAPFHTPANTDDATLARDFLYAIDARTRLPRAGEESRVPLPF